MLFLIENPVPREAFFPSGAQVYAVAPAQPTDADPVHDIIDRHTGHEDAAAWRRWWQRLPDAFRIVRASDDSVAGFVLYFDPAAVPQRWLEEDPICSPLLVHMAEQPLRGRANALVYRGQLDRERGEGPGDVQAACWLDLKRTYMEMRPHLQRVYSGVYDIATYGPIVTPLGFRLLTDPLEIDARPYYPSILDFGPGSVDAWLSWLVASELGIEEGHVLDEENRQLLLDGRRVDLTSLECRLMRQLLEQRGKTVTRRALLASVWGYEHQAAGSNVVDTAVRSLRRKLGDRAEMIGTVRGLGYRIKD